MAQVERTFDGRARGGGARSIRLERQVRNGIVGGLVGGVVFGMMGHMVYGAVLGIVYSLLGARAWAVTSRASRATA